MRRKHSDAFGVSRVDFSGSHNPLIRRSDRVQARVKNIVVALAIVMLPLSVWFGMATLSSQQSNVAEQQYSRHSVTATTTEDASADSTLVQSDFTTQSSANVDATWSFDGVEHSGQVSVTTGSPAGTESAVWVDNSGNRSTQPITDADAVAAALFTGIGSLAAVALLLYGLYAAVRFHLDTQREAEWELAIRNFLDENSIS